MPGISAAQPLPALLLTEDAEAPDRTLVADALAGDEGAFRVLYRRHTPRVLRLVRRLVGASDAECDDVLQEVWLRAMTGAREFRWNSPFQTWLCGIAVRVFAESIRRTSRRAEADLPDDVAAPEVDLARAIDLDRAISTLPDHHRTVFVLHDIEGRTHAEISEVLGIATGSSKAYLHHARHRMRALLRSEAEGSA